MHMWGDGFEYFEDVGQAANEVGDYCVKWGRISVGQTKEKFGTARVYLSFGIYSIYSICKPRYMYITWPSFICSIDNFISKYTLNLTFIQKAIVSYQTKTYRKAYAKVISKYPHIKTEILAGANYPELLKGLEVDPFYQRLEKLLK